MKRHAPEPAVDASDAGPGLIGVDDLGCPEQLLKALQEARQLPGASDRIPAKRPVDTGGLVASTRSSATGATGRCWRPTRYADSARKALR